MMAVELFMLAYEVMLKALTSKERIKIMELIMLDMYFPIHLMVIRLLILTLVETALIV